MDGYTNETYERNNCQIVIGDDWIRLWFDDDHHQDILYSEEAANAIRNGANPIDEGWEDGCGNQVSKENSEEARMSMYIVVATKEDSNEYILERYGDEGRDEAVDYAVEYWVCQSYEHKMEWNVRVLEVAEDYESC